MPTEVVIVLELGEEKLDKLTAHMPDLLPPHALCHPPIGKHEGGVLGIRLRALLAIAGGIHALPHPDNPDLLPLHLVDRLLGKGVVRPLGMLLDVSSGVAPMVHQLENGRNVAEATVKNYAAAQAMDALRHPDDKDSNLGLELLFVLGPRVLPLLGLVLTFHDLDVEDYLGKAVSGGVIFIPQGPGQHLSRKATILS